MTGILFQSKAQSSADSNVVFHYNNTMPVFPGGDEAFLKFIQENLVYPKDAQKLHITGTVFVEFVVNVDGSVSNIMVYPNRGLHPSYDQAAIDVISKSPNWQPGTMNGIPVKVKKVARVKFSEGNIPAKKNKK